MKKASTKTAVRARTSPAPAPAVTTPPVSTDEAELRRKLRKEKAKRKKAEAKAAAPPPSPSTPPSPVTPVATSFWTTGNVVLLIAVILLVVGSVYYAVNRGENMTENSKILASPQYEEIRRELDEAKAAAEEAVREREAAETQRLADEKAKEAEAEERDLALRQEMLDAIAALAKVETPAPAEAPMVGSSEIEKLSPEKTAALLHLGTPGQGFKEPGHEGGPLVFSLSEITGTGGERIFLPNVNERRSISGAPGENIPAPQMKCAMPPGVTQLRWVQTSSPDPKKPGNFFYGLAPY